MDAHRFDAHTRLLGTAASRRGLGKYLGGLALSGGTVVHWSEHGEAKKKHHKKHKRKKKKDCPNGCRVGTCCAGRCANTPTDGSNCGACGTVCVPGQYCHNSQCQPCESPMSVCRKDGHDRCVNLQSDPTNCGVCGNICGEREACRTGRCGCSGVQCPDGTCCPAGYEVCIGNGIGCCPNNSHYCGNGRCCPDGFTCGGSCGGECCA